MKCETEKSVYHDEDCVFCAFMCAQCLAGQHIALDAMREHNLRCAAAYAMLEEPEEPEQEEAKQHAT